MGNTIDQQIDHLLDSLLQFLSGDINDRFLAKKRIDEQRRLFKLAFNSTSSHLESAEKKEKLKELCGIVELDSNPNLNGNRHAVNSPKAVGLYETQIKSRDQRRNHDEETIQNDPRKTRIESSTRVRDKSESPTLAQNELLDYLRNCPKKTACVSDIEKKFLDVARKNGYGSIKDYLQMLDRKRIIRLYIQHSQHYVELSDGPSQSSKNKGKHGESLSGGHRFDNRKSPSRPESIPSRPLSLKPSKSHQPRFRPQESIRGKSYPPSRSRPPPQPLPSRSRPPPISRFQSSDRNVAYKRPPSRSLYSDRERISKFRSRSPNGFR